jgi:N6-L-threonylcarbamoyladenine synthase
MLVLGIESSCDETGVALYDTGRGLLGHALYSQISMHRDYGGVVPELASRDHIKRLVPLLEQTLAQSQQTLNNIDAIAVTIGPGLAGALLVGTGFAHALAFALNRPIIGVHHLEGHLLSPLLSSNPPAFPFLALLVSGAHTQLMQVQGVGDYTLLGETLDDAAGEAFDKSAKLLGLPYPGGPHLSRLALQGDASRFHLPRPLKHSGDLNFSFAGLKTAVLTTVNKAAPLDEKTRADLAASIVDAITDVLCSKALAALEQTGLQRLVVAGGVGANQQLRARLNEAAQKKNFAVYYPELEWCTDNGAMIALAGALRLQQQTGSVAGAFRVRPRWPLVEA